MELEVAVEDGMELEVAVEDGKVWFKWHGGARPVPVDAVVEYQLRAIEGTRSAQAGGLQWQWSNRSNDIVFYRVVSAGTPDTVERTQALTAACAEVFGWPTTGPYASLAAVLKAAFDQAATGKGKERHATADTAFELQPMTTINRQLGSIDGFIYQAHKKSLEAKRLPDGRAQAELLGAINYLAGAVIALDSWAKKS